jgi:hypothetical protein
MENKDKIEKALDKALGKSEKTVETKKVNQSKEIVEQVKKKLIFEDGRELLT